MTVGGASLCTSVVNQPCVSVTLCVPGTSACQTISDIILDTGSVGLRVFKSVLTVDFAQHIETDAQGNQIGECVIFGTGATWGPVATAGVIMAGEPGTVVPIQLIDATFAGHSASSNPCGQPVDTSPANSLMNGLLGIDAFGSDSVAGGYFSCGGQGCAPIGRPPNFVQNPVALLQDDNNGHVLVFPSVGNTGAPTVVGALVFGIGTQGNNTPNGASVFERNPSTGTITTVYKGTTYASFLDTGSTFLFFHDTTIPLCASIGGAYCPSSTLSLSATHTGANQVSQLVHFEVANAEGLTKTGNAAYNNLGGTDTALSGEFDWGFPFYLGRTVYTGISGRDSVLGIGPYWAY
ncbi:MAG: hypothetical protein NTNFB02_28540 [Nitrospira sp.]